MTGIRRQQGYRAHFLPLEPRMMFDAAAITLAVEAQSVGDGGDPHAGDHLSPNGPVDQRAVERDTARTASDYRETDRATEAVSPTRDIIFIDTAVADYRQLAAEWARRGEVVLIDTTRDGIDQVRAALAGRSDLSTIHIVSHGSSGTLQLGTTRIDGDAITGALAGSLAAIGRSLSADGDILIYGCDFAAGDAGARALAAFADVTGADVAASIDTTGYAGRGGDWDLERHAGAIEALGLASRDWVHTLDPNDPVPISVTADSLTVRDANGAVVASGATGFDNDNRSNDVGVGATATWVGAATFQGRSVDLRATVVSLSAGDAIRFNRPGLGGNPDDPTFLLRDLTTNNDATVQIRWELIDHATGNPLPADVRFTIADIDGIDGNPNTRETVTASTENLAYYTRERVTDIVFNPTRESVSASGTKDENLDPAAPVTPQSAATFDWSAVSSFTLTYKLTTNARTNQAQFVHDGDADFVYTDPVYVSIPRLDLDGNNSTAAGTEALTTFTEDGARVNIVDVDVTVENPMPSEGITGATVRLINWKAGDNFQVGTLPAGLTATIGAVTGGTQTITISGTGSEADYAAAFRAITFANSSQNPDQTQRVIEVTFSNDTLTSATAISRINVVAVNDAPVRVGTLPPRTTNDAATVSYPTAGGFSDADGDALTYSATGLPAGLTINAATGAISGTVNRSASQLNGGVYNVVVTARDPSNASQTQSFTITVANPPPDAVDDPTTTVAEDASVTIAVLVNDTDPDGDPLTVTAASALHGVVVRNAGGTLTYTPNVNYNGPDTITYTISDGQGGTDTATAAVTVTPVNDAPVRVGTLPSRSTSDAASVSYPTAGGFSDPEGDTLTYSATGLPTGLTINATTGAISGTVNRSASQLNGGVYNVVVTARDPSNASQTQNFTISVTNPAPDAVDDPTTTLAEDTSATIAVLANDTDPDGDPLTVTAASALHGVVVRNADGTLTYTPNLNYSGSDTITYTISDGQGGTDTATAAVTVTPVNDAPVRNGTLPARNATDAASVSYPTAGGFSDPDGDTLTYSATGLPTGLTINAATGVISGTVDRSASQANGGVYDVVITARDLSNASQTQSFTITIANPAPDAVNDPTTTLAEDTSATIAVLANDTDPDGDPLTVTAASALHGVVTINPNGTLTYTPNANYTGADTITYTISDGQGGTDTATAAITVTSANDAPVRNGTLPGRSDVDRATVSFATAGGFSDADNDPLTYTATGLPAGLTINAVTGVVSGTINRSASQANGGSYAVTITATDPTGAAVSQTFSYAVTNPAPIAVDDATVATPEDTAVTLTVLGNDSDPDGDPLTITAASALHGTVVRNPDGTLTYTPNANYNGPDTITYTISDGEGGIATARAQVTVTPVNDAPVRVGILPARSGADAGQVSIPTAGGFGDPDGDTLTYSASGLPAGLTINAATGVISGTLDRSASQPNGGTYTIVVTARDPSGATATQSFAFTAANPGPSAADDRATTRPGSSVDVAVLVNDSDSDGDPLTVTAATAANGTVAILPNGSLRYAPNAGFTGTDTVTYAISDGQGGSATATVLIDVTNAPPAAGANQDVAASDGQSVNLPIGSQFADPDGDPLTFTATGLPPGLAIDPVTGRITGTIDRSASQANGGRYTTIVAADDGRGGRSSTTLTWTIDNPVAVARNDTARTGEDTPVTIAVLANDSDADGDLLTVTAASAGRGTVTINPDGTLRYTPAPNFNGSDTISYTISDGQGGTASATVTVTVDPVNDAPATVGLPDRIKADGSSVSIPLAGGFNDPDGDPLTFTATGLPPGLSIDPATGVVGGTIVPNSATGGPNGNGRYPVTVTATDPSGARTSTTFIFTVSASAPTPANDAATTPAATSVTIPVLANDTDLDGDPLTIVGAITTGGTVSIANGQLVFTPAAGFTGTATIVYTVSDPAGNRATATALVDVTPVNGAPIASAIPAQTSHDGQAVALELAPFYRDPDGDPLRYSATGLPPGLSIDPATGRITGTIDRTASTIGTGTFRVTVTASDGTRATATSFDWSVENLRPIARDDAMADVAAAPVTIAVLSNDSDPDGDPLRVVDATAGRGTVTIGSDGRLTYAPGPGFAGSDVIVYTIDDGNGGQATGYVTVTGVPNAAPVVPPRDTQVQAIGGRPVAIDALAGATDADGDTLSIVQASTANGAVVVNRDGTLTFTPAQGFVGTTTITYRITDSRGGFADATIVVNVRNPATADVEQLLRIGRVTFIDPTPALAVVRVGADGVISNPLSLLDTVEGVRDLRSTRIGQHAIGDAVENIRTLRGTAINPNAPIAAEIARLDRLADRRDASDRLFDHRWSDFFVKGLTGFSVAADRNACIMVESVVRDGAIYLEVRDIAADNRAPIRSVAIQAANGRAAPDWIRVDPRGLAIIERPADADEIHLLVRVTRENGRVTTTPIVIQGSTGEVELDRKHTADARAANVDPATLSPRDARQAIAARLAASFE